MNLPTISDLIADLQHAKEIAIRNENANGIVLAVMSQAKLLALDKPVIKDVHADEVQTISELMNELSSEQAAITYKNIMG